MTVLQDPDESASCLPGELVLLPSAEAWLGLAEFARALASTEASGLLIPAPLPPTTHWPDLLAAVVDSDLAVGLLQPGVPTITILNTVNRAIGAGHRDPDLSAIHQTESLQALADALGALVGNPVQIISSEDTLLAFTPSDGMFDRIRTDSILHRRGDPALRAWLHSSGIMRSVGDSEWPLRVPPNPDLDYAGRVAMRVAVDGEVLGHVTLMETGRVMDERDFALIKEAAEAAGSIMRRGSAARRREAAMRARFVDDIVHGRVTSEGSVRALAHDLGWDIDRLHLALVTSIDNFESSVIRQAGGSQEKLHSMRERVEDLVHRAAMVSDPQAVVGPLSAGAFVLLGTNCADERGRKGAALRLGNRILECVVSAMPGLTVTVGASRSFPSFREMPESFRQSEMAARLGIALGGNRAVHYDDLGIHRLLFALRNEETAMAPALQRIIDYDQEHGTDLAHTLGVYLGVRCHLSEAAAKLCIHRNTLQYRLQRIEELGGISLDDRDDRLALELGVRLLELNQKLGTTGR